MNQNKINWAHSNAWDLICLNKYILKDWFCNNWCLAGWRTRFISAKENASPKNHFENLQWFCSEFKHSKKNIIDRKTRRWFFSRNAISQWDVFRLDCWSLLEPCSLSRLFDTRIKEKTNPSVRIQNNIKPNATFCFVRFALNFFDVMIKTHDW